jgi:molecular chaperone GrpE
MTRKKDRDTKPPEVEKDTTKEKQSSSSNSISQDISKESEKEQKSKASTEVKRISGTEPAKLEYYSKEHLVEKVNKLEADLKKKTEELKKVKDDTESWKSKYMRLQAEFENAQKRWDKNRKSLRIEYTASVLKSFLPLYDSFKKALSDDKENMKILKGFYDQFMSILKGHKAEPMEVKENEVFDYSSQEALTSIEKSDVPKNTILEVIQDGWKLENEVLRYAKVIISKEPKPPEPEPIKEEQKDNIENVESENFQQKIAEDEKSNNHENEDINPDNEYIS